MKSKTFISSFPILPMKTNSRRLAACRNDRPVGAPGLHTQRFSRKSCRPGALTRRFLELFNRPLACLLIFASALTGLDARENPSSAEAEVRNASVLYQQLVWVGTVPPSEAENILLARAIKDIKAEGLGSGIAKLESFVATHANSPWTPSLQANLGRYYFEHARYSDAIHNWETAWAATRAATDGAAKQVADSTFVNCGELLVGLGKVN